MKKTITILIAMLAAGLSIAQTKKIVRKPSKPATETTTSEPETSLKASTAGKYAKDLGNKMYQTDPVYGDRKQGFYLNIVNWKPLQSDDGKNYYIIKVELSWQEGTGGFGDWRKISYKGSIVTDEFGCNSLFLLTEKKEPSIMGLLKRARSLTQEQIEVLSSKDEWLTGITAYWEPNGCLNEN